MACSVMEKLYEVHLKWSYDASQYFSCDSASVSDSKLTGYLFEADVLQTADLGSPCDPADYALAIWIIINGYYFLPQDNHQLFVRIVPTFLTLHDYSDHNHIMSKLERFESYLFSDTPSDAILYFRSLVSDALFKTNKMDERLNESNDTFEFNKFHKNAIKICSIMCKLGFYGSPKLDSNLAMRISETYHKLLKNMSNQSGTHGIFTQGLPRGCISDKPFSGQSSRFRTHTYMTSKSNNLVVPYYPLWSLELSPCYTLFNALDWSIITYDVNSKPISMMNLRGSIYTPTCLGYGPSVTVQALPHKYSSGAHENTNSYDRHNNYSVNDDNSNANQTQCNSSRPNYYGNNQRVKIRQNALSGVIESCYINDNCSFNSSEQTLNYNHNNNNSYANNSIDKFAYKIVNKMTLLLPNHLTNLQRWLFLFELLGSKYYSFYDIYSDLALVGSGSFSKVYSGYNSLYYRVDAIKAVEKSSLSKANGYNEIHLISKLNHPCILRFYEAYSNQSTIVLTTEFICGIGLNVYLKKQTLTEHQAKKAIMLLIDAVAAMHSYQIVHRDLKNENIMLRDSSDPTSVCIIDFGLSSRLYSSQLSMRCGSPGFVAPEILNDSPEITEKSDLFSLGVIFYSMLTSTEPFVSTDNDKRLLLNAQGFASFESNLFDNISETAKSLLNWLLQKNPRNRCTAVQALHHPFFTGAPLLPGMPIISNSAIFLDRIPAEVRNLNSNVKSPIIHANDTATHAYNSAVATPFHLPNKYPQVKQSLDHNSITNNNSTIRSLYGNNSGNPTYHSIPGCYNRIRENKQSLISYLRNIKKNIYQNNCAKPTLSKSHMLDQQSKYYHSMQAERNIYN